MLELAADDGLRIDECNVSLSEVYTADEVFTTGTMGELTPVLEVDGRVIGDGSIGPITERVRELHRDHATREGEPLPR